MKRVFAGVIAVVALLSFGCGKGAPELTPVKPEVTPLTPYVGTWTNTDHGAMLNLTVLQTGRFSLSAVGPESAAGKNDGEKVLVTGSAVIQNGRLSLTASEVNGKAPTEENDKKPEIFLLSKDGKTLEAADGTKLQRQ